MAFKEMDPDDVRALLEGHQDILTPMLKAEQEFLKNQSCPTCKKANTEPFLDTKTPFHSTSPLPNNLIRCLSCGTEFHPRTGLISKVVIDE